MKSNHTLINEVLNQAKCNVCQGTGKYPYIERHVFQCLSCDGLGYFLDQARLLVYILEISRKSYEQL